MQQTIKPLGIATNPSDYDCADGELAASFNIINEDGALRPLPQPEATDITLQDGDEIRCIHATSAFKHYIATCEDENNVNNTIAWYNPNAAGTEDPIRKEIALPNVTHIYKVTPIGNTLCVLTDKGLFYLLWQHDQSAYSCLGNNLPELELQFGVSEQKELESTEYTPTGTQTPDYTETTFTLSELSDLADNIHYVDRRQYNPSTDKFYIEEDTREEITNSVWAIINRTNAEVAKEGHFYAPFLVRYCYRLYDGSMSMHSAPVFIPVSPDHTFHIAFMSLWNNNNAITYLSNFRYFYNNVALTYKCLSNLATIRNNWKDIIKNVDIFVSLPLTREDASKKIEGGLNTNPAQIRYENNTLISRNDWGTYSIDGTPHPCASSFDIPKLYSSERFWDKIKSTSDFYKIASYELNDTDPNTCLRTGTDNDHPDGYYEVNIGDGVLSTLATQEAMTDDYHSHNDVLPTIEDNRCITSLFNYNNRLSIAAASEKLFQGFHIDTMLPTFSPLPIGTPKVTMFAIVVRLKTEQGIKRVVFDYGNSGHAVSSLLLGSMPLFYPDNRAFAMDVYVKNIQEQMQVFTLTMKQHPLLNGATTNGYLITSLSPNALPTPHSETIPTANDTLTTLNQIRTSEVDNPFYYPAINYKRVGVGTILALSTSAKALSQGQFGQHPLYAFCTDGVWALGVDTTDGTFVPAQPFTRDVCSNPDSILQLDSTVLFPTDRGIMLVSGSQTQCITEKLDYPHFQLGILPQNILFMPSDPRGIPTTIRQYIKGCKMIYDYRNQRVIVFNPALDEDGLPAYTYAYVYSLKSGLWAMMQADFVATLNAYPHAMAVNSKSQLVEFPDASALNVSGDSPSQFYVTRPFKLGSNEHKTITALVQHGMIEDRQHIKLILYGSRDLVQWHVVGSSTTNALRGLSGTPYTAFRLAVIADLTATESLSDFSVEFTPKHTRVLK